MKSPPAEWALGIGHLVILDLIRDHGEPDNDTLSEVVRGYVRRHPAGDALFTVAIFAGAELLRRHILKADYMGTERTTHARP